MEVRASVSLIWESSENCQVPDSRPMSQKVSPWLGKRLSGSWSAWTGSVLATGVPPVS